MAKVYGYLGSGTSWAELDQNGYESVRELVAGKVYLDRYWPGWALIVTYTSVTIIPNAPPYFSIGERWVQVAGLEMTPEQLDDAEWPTLFDLFKYPRRPHVPSLPIDRSEPAPTSGAVSAPPPPPTPFSA